MSIHLGVAKDYPELRRNEWIGLRDNLQDTVDVPRKSPGVRRFSQVWTDPFSERTLLNAFPMLAGAVR